MSDVLALSAVGALVGFASTLTGLGAGLSLPLLALAGIPVPAALLALKLPVAASDLAAAAAGAARRQVQASPDRSGRRGVSAVVLVIAGAFGAACVCILPSGAAAVAVAATLVLAMSLSKGPASGAVRAISWSVYLGAFGVCAGLLMAWQARREGCCWQGANVRARQVGAAANSGAVLMLLALGHSTGSLVWTLALAQGLGSALAATVMNVASRRGRATLAIGKRPFFG